MINFPHHYYVWHWILPFYLVVHKVASHQGNGDVEGLDGQTGSGEERNVAQIPLLTNYVDHCIETIFQVFGLGPREIFVKTTLEIQYVFKLNDIALFRPIGKVFLGSL